MDRIEMFGNIAHNNILRVERVLKMLNSDNQDALEFITSAASENLTSFEKLVLEESNGPLLSGTLMNFVEIGMCGNLIVKGGTPNVNGLANEMTDLYARKNRDYGNSFDKSMDKFGLVVSAIRIGDKVNRLQSLVAKKGGAQVKDESIADTFMDLACYAIMTHMWLVGVEQIAEEDADE